MNSEGNSPPSSNDGSHEQGRKPEPAGDTGPDTQWAELRERWMRWEASETAIEPRSVRGRRR
jgi:hypothetical protein